MSVLVKGMNMPKKCDSCFMRDACEYSMPLSKRPADCPLVEVPAHGDLIDRDDLLLEVRRGDYETYNDYSITFDLIDCAPTVIGAEDGET